MDEIEKPKFCGVLVKCGKRFLLTHTSTDTAPQVINDGFWCFPSGKLIEENKEKTTAIKCLFDLTGIDLTFKRDAVELVSEYETEDKSFVLYSYNDKSQELMNHVFYSDSEFLDPNGNLHKSIDRVYWAAKLEAGEILSTEHKGKLFPKKSKVVKTTPEVIDI